MSAAEDPGSTADPRPITEARLLAMVNASGDCFWESDAQRRFVHISDNMCRTMGYAREELRGRSILEFTTPEYRAELMRLAAARGNEANPLVHSGPMRHEGEFFRKDGTRLWVETVSVPVFDEAGAHIGFFGITRDTTERKMAEQALQLAKARLEEQLQHIQALHAQLREQSLRDDLTGLHNRRHFVATAEDELQAARRHGTPLALVLLDIDHFKQVNDQHGHAAGDEALKAVGGLLVQTAREGGLACRLGGEEFAVLLPGMGAEGVRERAEHCRADLAALQVRNDGHSLQMTASFGLAVFPQEGDTLAALMKLGDHRLYRAKALGRNRVVGPEDAP